MTLSEAGAAAVTYAGGWGWSVFRLRPDSKMPGTAHGFHDATADSAQVVEEWTRHPNANVGIATGAESGLVVIDVDPQGESTVRALKRRLGDLPPTLVALTPRGAHAYFRHPGVEVRCSAGRLGHGVDIRGDGGYVVAPPSRINCSGYSWLLPDGQTEPLPRGLAPLPSAWADAFATRGNVDPDRRSAEEVMRQAILNVSNATEGTRNMTLNRAAFAVGRFTVEGALRESSVIDELTAAATSVGLHVDEAHRTIQSGLQARKRGR